VGVGGNLLHLWFGLPEGIKEGINNAAESSEFVSEGTHWLLGT
jgi:hypothetical protein